MLLWKAIKIFVLLRSLTGDRNVVNVTNLRRAALQKTSLLSHGWYYYLWINYEKRAQCINKEVTIILCYIGPHKIKSRIAMEKAAFNKKRALFASKMDLELRKKTSKMLRLGYSFIRCWNLDASGSTSETPGKFWNVVLEKDGEDQLDRSCEKWRIIS
jgi:hypothetical protein